MGNKQSTYTKEFKQQAVQLFQTSGKSKTHIARDLGISDSALSKWCKEYGERDEEAFTGRDYQIAIEEENRELKREVEILRQEREGVKKSGEYLRAALPVKFQFIDDHRHHFPLRRMCQVLDVSENGYYNWKKRGKSKRKQDDEDLAERIEDAYQQYGGKYGSPRIHAILKAQGVYCGRKRVARLMREKGLYARRRRRKE